MVESTKKKSIQKGNCSPKERKAVILLTPEKLNQPQRVKEAKLKIVKEVARTGDLSLLGKLESFEEDKIVVPEFTDYDLMVSRLVGMKEGALMYEKHDRAKQNNRTGKAAQQKRAMHDTKATYVEDAYIQQDKEGKFKNLSEHKTAKIVYEYVLPLLKSKKVNGVHVLKQKMDGSITGISLSFIKDVLQKSARIKHYPWRKNIYRT